MHLNKFGKGFTATRLPFPCKYIRWIYLYSLRSNYSIHCPNKIRKQKHSKIEWENKAEYGAAEFSFNFHQTFLNFNHVSAKCWIVIGIAHTTLSTHMQRDIYILYIYNIHTIIILILIIIIIDDIIFSIIIIYKLYCFLFLFHCYSFSFK